MKKNNFFKQFKSFFSFIWKPPMTLVDAFDLVVKARAKIDKRENPNLEDNFFALEGLENVGFEGRFLVNRILKKTNLTEKYKKWQKKQISSNGGKNGQTFK